MNPSTRSMNTGWSPERKLWDELRNAGKELSWRKIEFDPNQSHLLPESVRGVYLICASPPKDAINALNAYTILYTDQVKGRRRSLRNRFLEHISHPKPKLKLFVDCYYPDVHSWFAVAHESSRIDALEILLIGIFNLPCNSISAPETKVTLARIGAGRSIGASGRIRST